MLHLTAPHCTSLTHTLNEKSHFYISTCLQMFCFNCAALSSEYKVAHKHTTTRDKGDLDRILDIVYSGYFWHPGITFFSIVHIHDLCNAFGLDQWGKHLAAWRLYSAPLFEQPVCLHLVRARLLLPVGDLCCWVVSLGKGGTTEISRPPRSTGKM